MTWKTECGAHASCMTVSVGWLCLPSVLLMWMRHVVLTHFACIHLRLICIQFEMSFFSGASKVYQQSPCMFLTAWNVNKIVARWQSIKERYLFYWFFMCFASFMRRKCLAYLFWLVVGPKNSTEIKGNWIKRRLITDNNLLCSKYFHLDKSNSAPNQVAANSVNISSRSRATIDQLLANRIWKKNQNCIEWTICTKIK